MKNLLHIAMVAVFVLSVGCQKLSITKRKYTRGYYIAHSHKAPAVKGENKGHTAGQENRESVAEKQAVVNTRLPKKEISGPEPAPANQSPTAVTRSKQKAAGLMKNMAIGKEVEDLLPARFKKQAFKKKHDSLVGEALSLFWVVLLIILLLYLLGILFNGFGLGWAIHLFALIFLILLILWLLRVV